MTTNDTTPEPVFIIQPTGYGKSTVPLTYSVILREVTIILKNTLVLASNQLSKIQSLATSNIKHMKSYQLDTFSSQDKLQCLCDAISIRIFHSVVVPAS